MMYNDEAYYALLKSIDHLRLSGISENDSKMIGLRSKLRDFLEYRKKYKKDTSLKLVPKLTKIKTLTIDQPSQISGIDSKDQVRKFVLLGIVVAVSGVFWFFLKK